MELQWDVGLLGRVFEDGHGQSGGDDTMERSSRENVGCDPGQLLVWVEAAAGTRKCDCEVGMVVNSSSRSSESCSSLRNAAIGVLASVIDEAFGTVDDGGTTIPIFD